ncbi:MAG: hypothetical protein NVS3B12_34070 [Acidimicrobiales bacterium]
MALERLDKVWWHDPQDPFKVHHGWVEEVNDQGVSLAETAVPTVEVPLPYVHEEGLTPPVDGCTFCAAG